MKKDLDMKLYNEYLSGEKDAFEILYNKYKDKIQYFVYNIVKDYQKAEDITQEVFIYMLQNKFKKDCSFKRYLYIVAKSRAINYINMENNKTQIEEKYFTKKDDLVEKDILEILTKNETQKELIEAIDMLDDRYRNALYLVNIEEFSYKETAEILGESVQNVKNLVHRGKKELRKILAKKGFDDMNKVLNVIIIVLCVGIILVGGTYAAIKIVENFTSEAKLTPTYTSKIGETDTNKVWIGTFNLVWNDFMNDVVGGNIEFEDGESELANELNKQTFKANQLSDKSYFKIHGEASLDLKNKIENGIKEKFNENSKFLDRIDWNDSNGYVLYAMLKKEFEFLEPFSTAMGSISFNNSDTRVKCFGVDSNTGLEAGKNVTILFYNSEDDFAIRLKTKEGEEVILYKTSGEGKSFEENYQECLSKGATCGNERVFGAKDFLRIPFIKIQDEINYDELCGKYIKNSNYYIKQALQTIDFELNNVGGSVKSEAVIAVTQKAANEPERMMVFDSDFILYLKEESKEQPYFALKVDDISVLVPDELDENK